MKQSQQYGGSWQELQDSKSCQKFLSQVGDLIIERKDGTVVLKIAPLPAVNNSQSGPHLPTS